MLRETYTTTGARDEAISGHYTIWPNGTTREIEYTFPDAAPPRWCTVQIVGNDPYYRRFKGHADLRPNLHDAIIDAIRRNESLPPRIAHTHYLAELGRES